MEHVEVSRPRDDMRAAIDEMRPRLLRAARRLGHAPHEAEDLAQDVLLAFARGSERFEGRSALFSWLYRILLNRHVDLLRAREREQRPRPGPGAREMAPTPDVEEAGRVRAAMERLPRREHDVLFLRFFEEPYADVARIVDAPLGTVHSLAFHGLRRLRSLLEEDRP